MKKKKSNGFRGEGGGGAYFRKTFPQQNMFYDEQRFYLAMDYSSKT